MGFRRRWPGVSYGRGEDWHYVGDTGEPAFENDWVNASGLTSTAFRLREAGIVDLYVAAQDGTSPTIFTLPEGYRPSNDTGPYVGLDITLSPLSEQAIGFGVRDDGSVVLDMMSSGDAVTLVAQIFLTPPAVTP